MKCEVYYEGAIPNIIGLKTRGQTKLLKELSDENKKFNFQGYTKDFLWDYFEPVRISSGILVIGCS